MGVIWKWFWAEQSKTMTSWGLKKQERTRATHSNCQSLVVIPSHNDQMDMAVFQVIILGIDSRTYLKKKQVNMKEKNIIKDYTILLTCFVSMIFVCFVITFDVPSTSDRFLGNEKQKELYLGRLNV